MKGLDINAAYCSWYGTIAEDDAMILKILGKAGCVFYARTTEPQLLVRTSNVKALALLSDFRCTWKHPAISMA